MTSEEIPEDIIDGIVTLPTIPSVLADLNAAIMNEDTAASDIANIISRDPSTATKVLRLANSAYYGLRSEITTIQHAVTMLGFNIVRNLVLTATVFDTSFTDSIAGLFETEKFWRHSLGVGVAAKAVAMEAFPETAYRGDEFFVCGLVHDLGKLIFGQHLRSKFEQALLLSKEKSISLFEAEKDAIGCTHAEVGRLLARRWNLSGEIMSSVGYHHTPMEAPAEQVEFVAVTHIADILSRAKGIGAGGGVNPQLQRGAWDALGLSKRKIPDILKKIDNSMADQELAI